VALFGGLGFLLFILAINPVRACRRRRKGIEADKRPALVDLGQNLSGHDFLKEGPETLYKAG
jgi:hypothetical protein